MRDESEWPQNSGELISMDQARIESEKKVKSDKTSRPTRTAMSRANANVEENPSSLELNGSARLVNY